MANVVTLEDGRKIPVGDEFLRLSKDQQQQWVNEAAKKLPPAPKDDRTVFTRGTDAIKGGYKALDAGVAAGVAGFAGLPRMGADLAQAGLYGAVDKGREWLGQPPFERPENSMFGQEHWPSVESAQKNIQNQFYGGTPAYQPQDQIERYLKTIGEFSVGGATGPAAARTLVGKGLQKLGQVAAPAVASEALGQTADALGHGGEQGKYAEPVARFLGAVLGGGAHAYLTQPKTAEAVLARVMPGVTPQNITDAEHLMLASRAGPTPVPLTWSEALSRLLGRPVLTDLQRHLEASPQSAPQAAQFFGQRPQQVEAAVDAASTALSPGNVNPNMIGPRAADAANRTVGDIRNSINAATRPMYDAAGQHLVPQSVHAAMMANPLFAETIQFVRGHPALSQLVGPRSDRSIAMYDAVAKQLEQQSVNAANPLHPTANQAIPAVAGALGGDIKDIAIAAERNATGGPSSYEAALGTQARRRGAELNPALYGPTGRVAAATDTPSAVSALLPPGGPTAREHAQIGQTVRELVARDPTIASDLVRQHVERTYSQAAADLMSGPAQTGGAKFRQRLIGNRQEERNLQAVVENATPDGAERWAGFSRLLDILEATGTRLNVGSKTSYNTEIQQSMKSGFPVPAKIASNPLEFFKPLADKLENWKYGKNLEDLQRILTDPASARMLRGIAESNAGSFKGATRAMALVNYLNATKARGDEPAPPIR